MHIHRLRSLTTMVGIGTIAAVSLYLSEANTSQIATGGSRDVAPLWAYSSLTFLSLSTLILALFCTSTLMSRTRSQSTLIKSILIIFFSSVGILVWSLLRGHGLDLIQDLPMRAFFQQQLFGHALLFLLGIGVNLWVQAQLRQVQHREQELGTAANMLPTGARRLVAAMLQHSSNHWQPGARSINLRTASFVIHHDPLGQIKRALPTGLLQLRTMEVNRCLQLLLQEKILTSRTHDQQYSAVVDPLLAPRPCLDVLQAFCLLQTEGIPAIDRRLNLLASLFPVLDVELAARVHPTLIEQLTTKNRWLFHLDFDWTDQSVISDRQRWQYQASTREPSSSTMATVFQAMERHQKLGNVLWLSPTARDQLMLEAPLIAHTFQAWPVRMADGSDEILTFVAPFEVLIPRLEKFHNLAAQRSILSDRGARPAAQRTAAALQARMAQASDQRTCLRLLEALSSYPWQGFMEKDMALHILLQIHDRLQQAAHLAPQRKNAKWDKVVQRCREGVHQIGFPGQSLFSALSEVRSLRQIDTALEIARQPEHDRFAEIWAWLATMDSRRFSPEDRNKICHFLLGVPQNPLLAKNFMVATRALQTLANIWTGITAHGEHEDSRALDSLAPWVIHYHGSLLTLLLDCLIAIRQRSQGAFLLSSPTQDLIAATIEAHSAKHSTAAPASLRMRWELIHNWQPESLRPMDLGA